MSTSPISSGQWRLLIAVSQRHIASVLAGLARGFGVRTLREAYDSHTACALLKSTEFDAMILDHEIGPMDGIEMTRRMRISDDCPNKTMPVIMISGLSDKQTIITARDAGIHEFLRLPISGSALKARLDGAINRPRGFVETPGYTGPDRRRRTLSAPGSERRSG